MPQEPKNSLGDYGLADIASEQLERVVSSVETAGEAVAARGRQATEHVQEVADNFKTAVDRSVKEQPITTLVVAAAAGFILGALWKS